MRRLDLAHQDVDVRNNGSKVQWGRRRLQAFDMVDKRKGVDMYQEVSSLHGISLLKSVKDSQSFRHSRIVSQASVEGKSGAENEPFQYKMRSKLSIAD